MKCQNRRVLFYIIADIVSFIHFEVSNLLGVQGASLCFILHALGINVVQLLSRFFFGEFYSVCQVPEGC